MAAQVEVQPGEVGRTVAGGRLRLSPLTDSSNKSLSEIPSISESHIIVSEADKPAPSPKPRLTPKPFTVEKNPTIKPILAPKPQTKPRPESTRLAGCKPDLPNTPKPSPRPVSTNPNRPASTSFRTSNKLNTGQTIKLVVQPFKPAPPIDLAEPSKPTRPVPAERQKSAASSLAYSKSLKTLSPTEWSGTTTKQHESKQNGQNKFGTSITRAKSMGSLFEVEKEEEEKKDKVQPEVSVILRSQPRSSRPRPVSAIFSGTPTKTETPDPAPRWTGRRPLSADLTSKFESIGLSLHRKSPKANAKENTPMEKAPPPTKEQDKSPNSSTPESTEGVTSPTLLDQNDKKVEETTVKDAGIKSHVSYFLDSSSPPGPGAAGQDLHSSVQPGSEPTEPPVGVKQLIKQLTEDATPTQSPVLKPTPKPRPLPFDLTKRFSSEKSPELVSVTEAGTFHTGISKDPQTGTEESAVTPSDLKMLLDLKDSPEQLKDFSTLEGSEARQLWAASKESSASGEAHTVRASLFENVVEKQKVLMMDQGESANTANDSLCRKEEIEDKGTLVTATYKESISPSSPLRVSHAFDTMQAVEQNRAVSESVPVAQWEDKAMTLRSRRSEANRSVAERNEPAPIQPATAPRPEPQHRYLRVGALHKWTTSYLDGDEGPDVGTLKESEWDRHVTLDKDQDRQRAAYQDEVSAPNKRLNVQQAEEQTKPRAIYFALTGQMQEPPSPGEAGIKFGDTPFDDLSVRSALSSSQGKAFPARRNPSLKESFGNTSQSHEKFDELMLRSHTSTVDMRSQMNEQSREEMMEAEKREQKNEAERLRTKAKELEKEQQKQLEKEKQRIKEWEMQRQEALENEKQEFEEKERALERQKQSELENQRLQELEKKKRREIEKERQWQLQKEKQDLEIMREVERDKKREKEKQQQREEERLREMDKRKQFMQEMERMKEMERQQIEFQKLKQKEDMQQLVEKQRQRENAEKEAEKLRQMTLEQEMLKLREVEKDKAREMEIERLKEIEREKQIELEKRRQERELEKERQRQKEEEKQRQLDKEKQMMMEMERVRETERQQVLEFQKQKQKEKEMFQLMELEKQRQREKEAERLRQISLEQEMLRMKELEKERARQKEMEIERKMQKELERQRQQDLEREKQRQLDFERQQLDNERLRREQEKERRRKEELEILKEMEKRQLLEFEKQKQAEREKQNVELEKRRQKEKLEREEADKMRQIAKQQEAERQRIKEKQKKEEQERLRLESSALRPKVVDLDSVLRNDQLSKPLSPRSDPATLWREPYKPAILDIDSFTSQTHPSLSKDMMTVSGIQGLVDESGVRPQPAPERDVTWKTPSLTSVGFSNSVWTMSLQDPWELRPAETPVVKSVEPKKSTNKLSPEELSFKQEERPPNPQRNWSGSFNEPLFSASPPGTDPKTVNTSQELSSSIPGEQIWIPKELQSPQKSRVETKNLRRSHGFQDLNRMRSRSMSRRSAPASSAEEMSLFRMRSRSAHREQDRPNWVQQNQSGEEKERDSGTPVRDTDSQYGTWETGLRSDDSLTPTTPSSDGNLSPSPRKPTPLHSPGDPTSQLDTDTLDGFPPLSSSASQPLSFPDAPTALLDNSVLRSRAQLGKKRAPRTRPTKAARLSVVQTQEDGGASEDWLYKDSTEAKAESKDDDSESEETREADAGPAAASQPQRVALFPGVDPSALKAQLKKRSDSDNQTNGPGPSPSMSRSPKSPFLPRAARVLPPPGTKENSEEDSPQWLKELKSKKRLSQYESET